MAENDVTKVVLVAPVVDLYATPSLAVSLLKAGLENKGITCRVIYTNNLLVKALGEETYQALISGSNRDLFIERLFATHAHEKLNASLSDPCLPEQYPDFYRIIEGPPKQISESLVAKAELGIHNFLERIADEIISRKPSLVAFSSTYQTTNSILAMAKVIKRRLPHAVLLVGGNNCEGSMGRELAEKAEDIDFVFQGEADFAFPAFCKEYIEQDRLPKEKLVVCSTPADLDQVPSPDYSDFFSQYNYPQEQVCLTFETSRGCWWGHNHQCHFCGESSLDQPYRMRCSDRALSEVRRLQSDYPNVRSYLLADSILPKNYFNSFLPQLSQSGFKTNLICETKANLSRRQVHRLKQANIIRILPGIESLSTRLLIMLNKGTTAVANIRLLRHCREEGLGMVWLLIMGIPGDRISDYEDQLALMPKLQHLCPPSATPLHIQRNSPYFREGDRFGVHNITPMTGYSLAFPDNYDLARLACFFSADYPSEARENPEKLIPFMTCLRRWQESWQHPAPPELSIRRLVGEQWQISDTRDSALTPVRVIGREGYELLKYCRRGRPVRVVDNKTLAHDFLSSGFLIEVDGKLISLVCDNTFMPE